MLVCFSDILSYLLLISEEIRENHNHFAQKQSLEAHVRKHLSPRISE